MKISSWEKKRSEALTGFRPMYWWWLLIRTITMTCYKHLTLVRLITACVVAFSLCGAAYAESASDSPREKPFEFIQMADTQLGLICQSNAVRGVWYRLGWQWFCAGQCFVSASNCGGQWSQAWLCSVCGDLINRPGHAGQISKFKRIASPTYGAWWARKNLSAIVRSDTLYACICAIQYLSYEVKWV